MPPGPMRSGSRTGQRRLPHRPADERRPQTIQVGGGPAGVAVGGGAVWVANGLDGTVSRIDTIPTRSVGDHRRQRPQRCGGREGAVWVANSADGTVSKIPPGDRPGGSDVPGGDRCLGRRRRLRPRLGRVSVPPESGPPWTLVRAGFCSTSASVSRPSAVAAGADAVWDTNRADGHRLQDRPSGGRGRRTGFPVGRGPAGIAAGPSGIWVANGADGTLYRTSIPERHGRVDGPARQPTARASPWRQQGVYVGCSHRQGMSIGAASCGRRPPTARTPSTPRWQHPQVSWSSPAHDERRAGRLPEGRRRWAPSSSPDLAGPAARPDRRRKKTYTFQVGRGSATRTGSSCSPTTSSVRSSVSLEVGAGLGVDAEDRRR